MGVNHGNGVPGKNTAGSLGDIYINDTTGEYYKCNLAIKISGSEGFEYEWKKMKSPFSCPAGEEGTDGTPYIKQDSMKMILPITTSIFQNPCSVRLTISITLYAILTAYSKIKMEQH